MILLSCACGAEIELDGSKSSIFGFRFRCDQCSRMLVVEHDETDEGPVFWLEEEVTA